MCNLEVKTLDLEFDLRGNKQHKQNITVSLRCGRRHRRHQKIIEPISHLLQLSLQAGQKRGLFIQPLQSYTACLQVCVDLSDMVVSGICSSSHYIDFQFIIIYLLLPLFELLLLLLTFLFLLLIISSFLAWVAKKHYTCILNECIVLLFFVHIKGEKISNSIP